MSKLQFILKLKKADGRKLVILNLDKDQIKWVKKHKMAGIIISTTDMNLMSLENGNCLRMSWLMLGGFNTLSGGIIY